MAVRDQNCGALAPPAPLALDKQRRLCLTTDHASCATYRAAGDLERLVGPEAAAAAQRIESGVTRWSLVRTVPLVLDQGRAAQVAVFARRRTGGQLVLGGLMAMALAAVVLARLPAGAGDPSLAGGPLGASLASSSPQPVSTPAPTSTPRATVSPTIAVAADPPASDVPLPSTAPEPAVSAPPEPTAAPPAATATYLVQQGDTLYEIAIRLGTTVKTLQDLNGLGSSTTIRTGEVLKVP